MLHTLARGIGVMAKSSSDTPHLVGGDACSYPTAAYEDAAFCLASLNSFTDGVSCLEATLPFDSIPAETALHSSLVLGLLGEEEVLDAILDLQ